MLQPLVLTGFGGLLAIMGTIAGYLLQTREARHARSESYKREDIFRLHQNRREVYRDFHTAASAARMPVNTAMKSPDNTELREKVREARDKLHDSYVPLWHIGAEEVVQAARRIMEDISSVGWANATSSWEHWMKLINNYVLAVRNELLNQHLTYDEAVASGALSIDSGNYRLPEFDFDPDRAQA